MLVNASHTFSKREFLLVSDGSQLDSQGYGTV